MRKPVHVVFAASLILALPGVLHADDQADLQGLLGKAIKNMGGEAKLAKLKNMSWKAKGTNHENNNEAAFTFAGSLQGLDRFRMDAELEINGAKMAVSLVVNGKQGWGKHNDMVTELRGNDMLVIQQIIYGLRIAQMQRLIMDKAMTLSTLGEMKIGERETVGIRLSRKDQSDINVYFDKQSSLPYKAETTVKMDDQEKNFEFFLTEYKNFGDIKHFTKAAMMVDGKKILEIEFTEIKFPDKLEDSLFAKPE